jgi:hypothetical protein
LGEICPRGNVSDFLRFLRPVHLPEPVDDRQIVLAITYSEKLEPANSAGGKVKNDVLIDRGLANSGWLFERVNGLFNSLASE